MAMARARCATFMRFLFGKRARACLRKRKKAAIGEQALESGAVVEGFALGLGASVRIFEVGRRGALETAVRTVARERAGFRRRSEAGVGGVVQGQASLDVAPAFLVVAS